MIKYCIDKWNKNRDKLEEALMKDSTLNCCDYHHLVKMVVKYILNDEDSGYGKNWDADNITEIDNGNYQGTLLFIIPADTYQPSEYEYLMTYVRYGSCSVCDTLQSIRGWGDEPITPEQIKDFMGLCKDLVTNMIKPYNTGWRASSDFEVVSGV